MSHRVACSGTAIVFAPRCDGNWIEGGVIQAWGGGGVWWYRGLATPLAAVDDPAGDDTAAACNTIVARRTSDEENKHRGKVAIIRLKCHIFRCKTIKSSKYPHPPHSFILQPWLTWATVPSSLRWTLRRSGLWSFVTIEPGSMIRVVLGRSVLQNVYHRESATIQDSLLGLEASPSHSKAPTRKSSCRQACSSTPRSCRPSRWT